MRVHRLQRVVALAAVLVLGSATAQDQPEQPQGQPTQRQPQQQGTAIGGLLSG